MRLERLKATFDRILDGAQRDIDCGDGQKQRIGGDEIAAVGQGADFIKRPAGIDAGIDLMQRGAEIAGVFLDQGPVAAHLAAITGIDAGMQIEVRQRQMIYWQGRFWDRLILGISAQQWNQRNTEE